MNRSPASVSQIGPSVDFSPPREIQQMMDKKKYSVSNNPESLTFSERQGKLMQRAVGRDKYMKFDTGMCGHADTTPPNSSCAPDPSRDRNINLVELPTGAGDESGGPRGPPSREKLINLQCSLGDHLRRGQAVGSFATGVPQPCAQR